MEKINAVVLAMIGLISANPPSTTGLDSLAKTENTVSVVGHHHGERLFSTSTENDSENTDDPDPEHNKKRSRKFMKAISFKVVKRAA